MRYGLSAVVLVSFALLPVLSDEKKADKVAYEVYAKGYFLKNTVKLTDDKGFFVFRDKKSFDGVFGFGRVMGPKPKLVDDKLFEGNVVVTAVKSGSTLWKFDIDSVRVDKKQLIVEFKTTGKDNPGAKFNSSLIVAVPRGDYTEVVFIENGKEAGKAAVKK